MLFTMAKERSVTARGVAILPLMLMGAVHLSVTPPPQMPATMEAGTSQGYCVGEPWNQQAVFKGIGVPVITDYEIWPNNPEKVFGVTEAWAEQYPNTHLRLLRALIRAAHVA